ncbi:MAG: hypothetical protein JY451_07685 [Erythrobacter sp.]|nr:MAG: hypothetical protein JY451_07685 [Erythrobacter sp.]
MPGFGYGFGIGHRSLASAVMPLPQIAPSPLWIGTAGSGFASVPLDPVRTTAKPACRLLVPPGQFFTDSLVVGVAAAANDGGSLIANLGLAKVVFHYEGESVEVLAPSYHTLSDANGVERTYLGWWARLQPPASGVTQGLARLYVEAVAIDPTMQKRVIGPYLFCPSAQIYDVAVDVAPLQPTIAGQRYPSITAAATYVKAQLAKNPHICIIEAGTYDIGDSNPDAWTIPGYCTISATQPVTLGKSAYTTDNASRMTAHRMPLHLLGANITVDFRHVLEIDAPSIVGVNHWLDGVTLTNSHPDGRDMLWRGGPPAILGRLVEGEPWFTECVFSEVHTPARNANLVRGCTFTRISQDVVSNARCVVGTSVVDHSNLTWNTDFPAFTVTYSGAEATATLARSGGTESSGGGGLYTARWGASSATFDVGNGSFNHYAGTAGQGYWFADVVAWLNTLPGWNATLLINPDRRACTGSLEGDKGLGFDGVAGRSAPVNVKDATVTIVSLHDKHGDWYQQDTGTSENVIVYDNTGVDMEVQCIFLSPIANGDSLDYVFFNNAFSITATVSDYFTAAYSASQLGRDNTLMSHVVIAHNSFANQGFLMRTDRPGCDFDSYCLFANNVSRSMVWQGAVDTDLVNTANHQHGGFALPGGDSGTSSGGSEASLFAGASAGDFTPAGELLANPAAPVVSYDLFGKRRGASAAKGAVA